MVSTANTAINSSTTSTQLTSILNAQKTISNYLASLRVYAAQTSVAVGNLYYILSKRLPQQDATNQNTTSQALNELTMASRRLYNPNSGNTAQWLDMINNASPSTVQKEMAILLSEINYQLYLNRQQEERLLLTNSLLLIQALKQNAPTADFSTKQ
jgi:intracellular multiplication protein IcmX